MRPVHAAGQYNLIFPAADSGDIHAQPQHCGPGLLISVHQDGREGPRHAYCGIYRVLAVHANPIPLTAPDSMVSVHLTGVLFGGHVYIRLRYDQVVWLYSSMVVG